MKHLEYRFRRAKPLRFKVCASWAHVSIERYLDLISGVFDAPDYDTLHGRVINRPTFGQAVAVVQDGQAKAVPVKPGHYTTDSGTEFTVGPSGYCISATDSAATEELYFAIACLSTLTMAQARALPAEYVLRHILPVLEFRHTEPKPDPTHLIHCPTARRENYATDARLLQGTMGRWTALHKLVLQQGLLTRLADGDIGVLPKILAHGFTPNNENENGPGATPYEERVADLMKAPITQALGGLQHLVAQMAAVPKAYPSLFLTDPPKPGSIEELVAKAYAGDPGMLMEDLGHDANSDEGRAKFWGTTLGTILAAIKRPKNREALAKAKG